jgi:hypothetical protein
MVVLHTRKKGRMFNNLEKFHIYKETKNNQINDLHTVAHNAIFDTILSTLSDRTPQYNNSPAVSTPQNRYATTPTSHTLDEYKQHNSHDNGIHSEY